MGFVSKKNLKNNVETVFLNYLKFYYFETALFFVLT